MFSISGHHDYVFQEHNVMLSDKIRCFQIFSNLVQSLLNPNMNLIPHDFIGRVFFLFTVLFWQGTNVMRVRLSARKPGLNPSVFC